MKMEVMKVDKLEVKMKVEKKDDQNSMGKESRLVSWRRKHRRLLL